MSEGGTARSRYDVSVMPPINHSIFDHAWQPLTVSPWYIPLICIRENEASPPERTPITLVTMSLCRNAGFFDVVFRVPPSLHFYMESFYRINVVARRHRFAHVIQLVQKEQFAYKGLGVLEQFPFKYFMWRARHPRHVYGV
jgi:hypothetical protein